MKIDKLLAVVLKKQQVLSRIYEDYGHLSLVKYVETWKIGDAGSKTAEFLAIVQEAAAGLYGRDVALRAVRQLQRQPLVSTVDHLGIFGHPFFLNSNVIYSLRPAQEYLICLPTAGVSLNNSSWPGCLLASARDGQMLRLSFFPDKQKTAAVLAVPPFSGRDLKRMGQNIARADFLGLEHKQKLTDLLDEIFAAPEVLGLKDFSSQAAAVSALIWRKIFPSAPALLYLPLEDLVSQFLVRYVAQNEAGVLHWLLFKADGWDAVEQCFDGSLGAFSHGHKGSFLFWGIDRKGRRARLFKDGAVIVNEQRNFTLRAGQIAQALRDKTIYPTTLVCFLVLLDCQMTCLGGFNQVNWLAEIKQKFAGLVKKFGDAQLAERLNSAATGNFAEADLVFAVAGGGQVYKPTALDLFLRGHAGTLAEYRELAGSLTLAESLACQLPEIYKVITPEKERDPALSSITPAEILGQSGAEAKIRRVLLRPGWVP